MHDQLEEVINRAIESRVFPGCEVGYIRDGKTEVVGFGNHTYEHDSPAVRPTTIYDVASITKSIPTSSIVLSLIESGRLKLEDKVADFIPQIQNDYRNQITVKHLLTYTVVFDLPAGLSGLAKEHGKELVDHLLKVPLIAPPGEAYYYTNAPAVVLGLLAERVTGKRLDQLGNEMFFRPLGMTNTSFAPQGDVAPTEIVEGRELRGIVHDEGARASDKTIGNAGLFSTAGDLLIFAQMLLNGGVYKNKRYFSGQTIAQMHTNQLNGDLRAGLGWELHQRNIMGERASASSFGKTGFTGCIIIIDPKKEAAMVHLSNRTYPSRPESRDPINACRRELSDIVFGD
jgi:CubicO group peptidase (beta-lactamase class C family)